MDAAQRSVKRVTPFQDDVLEAAAVHAPAGGVQGVPALRILPDAGQGSGTV